MIILYDVPVFNVNYPTNASTGPVKENKKQKKTLIISEKATIPKNLLVTARF